VNIVSRMRAWTGYCALIPALLLAFAGCQQAPVDGHAPVVTFNNPPITGSKAVGGTLTASYVFSDPDGDSEGASMYQWYRFTNSTDVPPAGEAISGATAKSYKTVDPADTDMWLRVEVTPVDALGTEGTPVLSGPVQVHLSNDPPVVAFNIPPITGSTALGGTLTASYVFSDPEGGPDLSTYQWYRFANSTDVPPAGEAIAGATARSYTSVDLTGNSDSGKWLRVEVTPVDDPGATGMVVLSDPVQVNTRIVIDTFPAGYNQNDTYLTLIDAGGTVLAEDDNGFPNQATYVGYSRIDVTQGLPVGIYYVMVSKPTEDGNPNYGFRVLDYDPGASFPIVASADEDERIAPLGLDHFDDAVDGNGVPTNPQSIAIGGVVSRSIFPEPGDPDDPTPDVDWFELVIP
jgi:hypothetical protein